MFETNVSEQFLVAVKLGKTDEVQRIAKHGPDVNVTDSAGRTALHLAAYEGRKDLVKALIDLGCDVNAEDQDGCTPLYRAVLDGHADIVNQLINAGSSLDKQDKNGSTALLEAAWNGYSQTVQLLVSAKCDINITNKGNFTALHLAAQNDHCTTLEILLRDGCDPVLKNSYGDTALHTAAKYGHIKACNVLIENGGSTADQNNDGDTVLHLAAEHNYAELVEYLLDVGSFTTIQNKNGETARDIAVKKGYKEIAHMIHGSNSPKPNLPTIQDRHESPVVLEPADINVSAVSASCSQSSLTSEDDESPVRCPKTKQKAPDGGQEQTPAKDAKPKTHKLRYEELCSIERAFLVEQDLSKNKTTVTRAPYQPARPHIQTLQNDPRIYNSLRRDKTTHHAPPMPEFHPQPGLWRTGSDTSLHIKPSLWDLCGILTCFSRHTSPAYRKTKVHKYRVSEHYGDPFMTPMQNRYDMNSYRYSHNHSSHRKSDHKQHRSKERHSRSSSRHKEHDRSKSEPKHAWNEENHVDSRHSGDKHHKHRRSKSEPTHRHEGSHSRDSKGKEKRHTGDSSHKRDKSIEKETSRRKDYSADRNSHRKTEKSREKERGRERHKEHDTHHGREGSKGRDSSKRSRDRSKHEDSGKREKHRGEDTSKGRGSSKDKSRTEEGRKKNNEGKDRTLPIPSSEKGKSDRLRRERARESMMKARQRDDHKMSVSAHVHEVRNPPSKHPTKMLDIPLEDSTDSDSSRKRKPRQQSLDGDADSEFSDSSDDGSIRMYLNRLPFKAEQPWAEPQKTNQKQPPKQPAKTAPKTMKAHVVKSLNRLEAKQDKCVKEMHKVQTTLEGRIVRLEDKVDDHITSSLSFDGQCSPMLTRKYPSSKEGNSLSDGKLMSVKAEYICIPPTEHSEKQSARTRNYSPRSDGSFQYINGDIPNKDIESLERRGGTRMASPQLNEKARAPGLANGILEDEPSTIVRAHYIDSPVIKEQAHVGNGDCRSAEYRHGSTGSTLYESSRPSTSSGDPLHSTASDDCVFSK